LTPSLNAENGSEKRFLNIVLEIVKEMPLKMLKRTVFLNPLPRGPVLPGGGARGLAPRFR